jgi:hypothetical protein
MTWPGAQGLLVGGAPACGDSLCPWATTSGSRDRVNVGEHFPGCGATQSRSVFTSTREGILSVDMTENVLARGQRPIQTMLSGLLGGNFQCAREPVCEDRHRYLLRKNCQ